jgi:hypothetical protein
LGPVVVRGDEFAPEIAKEGVCATGRGNILNVVPSSSTPQEEKTSILQVSQVLLLQHNTRVKLRPAEFEEVSDDAIGEYGDRESVKRNSLLMVKGMFTFNTD